MYTIYHPSLSLLPGHVKFLDQVASIIERGVSMQPKILPIDYSHITALVKSMDVVLQRSQLIILTLVEWQNGDAVIQLHSV